MINNDNVVFDVCMDMEYSYTYYGRNINGLATVSIEGYDDMIHAGVDTHKYILWCFMNYDTRHDNLKNHNKVYRLDIEITQPGIITPIFKGIE